MDAVNLFTLASTQAKWLSLRQASVANNIANADSPSYRAVDAEPFSAVLGNATVRLESTSPAHFGAQPGEANFRIVEDSTSDLTSSGQGVTIEDELVKSSEIKHAFQMNTAIVSAFHRMILMAAKTS
jgi:flagellar basal-body rod protein FlgB